MTLRTYADYEHDEYSAGSPLDTICCRADLDQHAPTAFGCYDAKVSRLDYEQRGQITNKRRITKKMNHIKYC